MDQAEYVARVRAESTALAQAAAGHLERPVPPCPDWTVADLVGHMGTVYGWVTGILAAEGKPPTGDGPEPPPERDDLLPWFAGVRDQVVADLAAHHPEDPAWVFVPWAPQNAGWWCRRQALESAIHRFDAQSASGTPDPIDPVLAAEGIDEYLTGLLPRMARRRPLEGLTGTFHAHTTDTAGEWSLDFDTEGLAVKHEHSKADTAVRGPAGGLYLWMVNRQSVEEAGLEVFGNQAIVDAWRNLRF
jgi:uncharacterized protein (TIGR03083 family)